MIKTYYSNGKSVLFVASAMFTGFLIGAGYDLYTANRDYKLALQEAVNELRIELNNIPVQKTEAGQRELEKLTDDAILISRLGGS